MPAITVDCAVVRYNENAGVDILLIKRRNDPYKGCWALPGGYMEIDETLDSAVKREVMEETGIDIERSCLKYLNDKIFDNPNRDERGRVVTVLSVVVVPNSTKMVAGDDAMDCKWFSLRNLPSLAFDHADMIEHAKKRLNYTL
jgi:8-oxo-dGTP diphosphatase